MGVLNVTPDSFSDGGSFVCVDSATHHALNMLDAGAEILDIGGESTRPGAMKVDCGVELERTIPVIEAIRKVSDAAISIDTSKAIVAKLALEAGADIINDITGLQGDPEMLSVCQMSSCGIIVMHMQGSPESMQDSPKYANVCQEVAEYFKHRYDTLTKAGISADRLCFDPGIGFGKLDEHNLALLRHLDSLRCHQRPLLLGVSRKSFIGRVLNDDVIKLRDWPTAALTSYGRIRGAEIHRVHRVKENVQALKMTEAILNSRN